MSLFFFLGEKSLCNSGSFFGFLSNFHFVFLSIFILLGPARRRILNFQRSNIKTDNLAFESSLQAYESITVIVLMMLLNSYKKIVIHISALYFNYVINIKLYKNTFFSHSECITIIQNLYGGITRHCT